MKMKKRMIMIALFFVCVAIGGLYSDIVLQATTISNEYLYNLPDVETDLTDETYAKATEWKITSVEGFNKLTSANASKFSGCTIYLANDINNVVGGKTLSNVTFEGLNHTITLGGECSQGLFSSLSSCNIRNLNVNGQIIFYASLQSSVGLLCNSAYSSYFTRCSTSGSMSNSAESMTAASSNVYIGGLVGNARYCTFTCCSNKASITYPMTRITKDDVVYIGGIVGSSTDCDLYGCYQSGSTLGDTYYWSYYAITYYQNGYSMVGYQQDGTSYTPVIEGCYSEAALVTNSEVNPFTGGWGSTTHNRNYYYKSSSFDNAITSSSQATVLSSVTNGAEIAWKMNYKDGTNNGWWTVNSSTKRPVLASSVDEAIYRFKWTSSDSNIYSTYGTEYYNGGKSITVTINDVPDGYQFNGVRIGDTLYDAVDNSVTLTMPVADVSAIYDFSLIKYDVTYHLDEGTNAASNPAKIDVTTACTLEPAAKEGYRFVGWYDNEACTGEAVTEIVAGTQTDLELWARYEKLYMIQYVMDGGSNHTSNPYEFTAKDKIVLQTPSKEGHTFLGWFLDSTCETSISEIPLGTTENQTIYAGWKINEYTITFHATDYPDQEVIRVTYGSDISGYEPAEPTKTDYLFGGWYTSQRYDEKFEFTTMPAKNITLYAKWYKVFMEELSYSSVSDVTYNGSAFTPTMIVKDGDYTLIKGVNYDIEYRNNMNPGTASIVITGKGFYEGEKIIPFKIKKISQQIRFTSLSFSKKVGDAPFNLGITTVGEGAVSYTSSNTAVATVNQAGYVTIIAAGSTYITVTMAETPYYTKSSCKIGITVAEGTPADSNDTQSTQLSVGATSKVNGVTYKVTATDDKNEVAYVKADTKLSKVVIPSSVVINGITYNVTSIAENAFSGNKKMTSVSIPLTVMKIEANAFKGCIKLKSIIIPKNVTEIGNNAFYNCKKLATIKFNGTKLTKIDKGAFRKCSSLKTVTIPKSVTEIGKDAFRDCKKLKTIIIKGTKLKKIGKNAFKNIYKSPTIKVPKSKKKTYKNLLIKSGYKKTMK